MTWAFLDREPKRSCRLTACLGLARAEAASMTAADETTACAARNTRWSIIIAIVKYYEGVLGNERGAIGPYSKARF